MLACQNSDHALVKYIINDKQSLAQQYVFLQGGCIMKNETNASLGRRDIGLKRHLVKKATSAHRRAATVIVSLYGRRAPAQPNTHLESRKSPALIDVPRCQRLRRPTFGTPARRELTLRAGSPWRVKNRMTRRARDHYPGVTSAT